MQSNQGNTRVRGVVSALLWTAIALVVLIWVPLLALIFAVTVPFDPGRYTVGLWFRRAAVLCVAINPLWRFRTSGVMIDDPRRPYVVVANHESYADIFLISHLPWEMKWLSKAEIMRLPLMGWLMRMAGDIPVRRGESRSRAGALDGIRDRLAKRVSVIVLPEGTRAPSEELLPFRDGAFRVAVELGLPILPIAVAGTRHAMARGSFRFNRANAEARVLEPVETAGLTAADVPALREDIRKRIDQARRTLQVELGLTSSAGASGAPAADPGSSAGASG
jgi:1-acyl-sn-glycerol-3-phosphate acyltransferase